VKAKAVFAVSLIYFIAIGAASVGISIASYAPWPDEMWAYHMSVGVLYDEAPQSVLTFPLFGHYLPYVSGNYQGAYKLYLHLLFLAIGGEAVAEYYRYINLALLVAVGLSMVWALRPIAGRWLAAIPLLLAISDPQYVTFIQTDMGPFLIQNVFTALSFGFLLRVYLGAGPRQLVAALFFASAVVSDKLTGIPVAVGLGVACLVIALRRRDTLLAPRWLAAYSIALILPILTNVIYILRAGISAVTSAMTGREAFAERVWAAIEHFAYTLSGAYSYMLATIYRAPTTIGVPHDYFAVGPLALVMAAVCTLSASARRSPQARATLLLFGVFVVTLTAFLSVQGLTQAWHYLIFNPLVYMTMAAIVGWAACYGSLAGSRLVRRTVAIGLAALALNFAIAQYNVVSLLLFQASHRGTELASTAIYPLIDKLKALGVRTVVCLDYSPCASVLVLTAGAIKVVDFAYSADFEKEPLETTLQRPNTVLLLRQIYGIEDPAWADRIQKGTRWFLGAGHKSLPPVQMLPLDRVDDTQYTIVTTQR
jgi:hypothetical protein